MGKPEATIWEYQATVHVWVRFEDGRATGLMMEFPEDDLRSTKLGFQPPVDVGMTQGQVEAVLGPPPSETCNRYPYSAELWGQVCFAKGRTVVSKETINVVPPPPLMH